MLIVKVKRNYKLMKIQLQYYMQNLSIQKKGKQILSLFKSKGNKSVDPFDYLNQYCRVKVALIFEGLYLSNNIVSLQIKVHEVYVKEIPQRKSLMTIEEDEDEENEDLKRRSITSRRINYNKFIFNTTISIKNLTNHQTLSMN